jgi:hypothetical protein
MARKARKVGWRLKARFGPEVPEGQDSTSSVADRVRPSSLQADVRAGIRTVSEVLQWDVAPMVHLAMARASKAAVLGITIFLAMKELEQKKSILEYCYVQESNMVAWSVS